ncbi:MAG: M24 family metallopeptidase, partial [Carboxydocellales bacterium]
LPLPKTLGFELDVLPVNNYLQYAKIFPESTLVDVSGLIKQLRLIKSTYELNLLRDTAKIMDRVHQQIPGVIKQGMTELELSSIVEAMARREGHEGFIRMRAFNQELYYGHLLSGANAAVPSFFDGPTGGLGLSAAYPHSASNRVIENNCPIIIDYAGVKNGYIIDLTRVYSIGELPEQLIRAFDGTLLIQKEVIKAVKPGVNCGDLYELALSKAIDLGYGDNFMGFAPSQAKFVGHGVGLELDEMPVMAKGANTKLATGMVIAIEPKFVFPGVGVVGIENTFVVNENGSERLTTVGDDLITIL